LNGKRIISGGNSFAAAEFTALLYKIYQKLDICDIELLLKDIIVNNQVINFEKVDLHKALCPSFITPKTKLRAIAFPFSKEIQVLAANEDMLSVEILEYYDIRESGKVGQQIQDIIGYGNNNKKIKNVLNLDELVEDFDLIICGHIDQLSYSSKTNWLEYIKNYVINNSKYVYHFDPLQPYTMNDKFFSPITISQYNGYTFNKQWYINTPVLAVMGTSSHQGKFSMQIRLRKALITSGYSVKQISTEPTGVLLGMDMICPTGYNSSINLTDRELSNMYNELTHICDSDNPDIILVGNQASTLHNNITNVHIHPYKQYSFMVGTQPDAVVLVINAFDDINYINRTIAYIESIIDSPVLCCALSPVRIKGIPAESFLSIDELRKRVEKPIYSFEQFSEIYESVLSYFQ